MAISSLLSRDLPWVSSLPYTRKSISSLDMFMNHLSGSLLENFTWLLPLLFISFPLSATAFLLQARLLPAHLSCKSLPRILGNSAHTQQLLPHPSTVTLWVFWHRSLFCLLMTLHCPYFVSLKTLKLSLFYVSLFLNKMVTYKCTTKPKYYIITTNNLHPPICSSPFHLLVPPKDNSYPKLQVHHSLA